MSPNRHFEMHPCGTTVHPRIAKDIPTMCTIISMRPLGLTYLQFHSMLVLLCSISLPPQITNPSSHGSEVIKGHPQEKYLPCLPMSYGIPLFLVQQLGTPQETDAVGQLHQAFPSILFHNYLHSCMTKATLYLHSLLLNLIKVMDGHEELQQANHHVAAHHMDSSIPSTSGVRLPDVFTWENNQQMVEQVRSSSHGLGRRYFRQQKWNTYNYGSHGSGEGMVGDIRATTREMEYTV